jgi:predicted Zn-dependent protease
LWGIRRVRKSLCLPAALALAVSLAPPAVPAVEAQERTISLVRDAEVEATIEMLVGPVFEAARVGTDQVSIYLVNDRRLNAFVAGGSNLFLNTGLLMATEDATEVIGVVAHETGHIAGGHLARMGTAMRRATAEAVLATILGAAVAAAGAPEVGTAMVLGGHSVAERGFLRFTRSQEQQADQAALTYMDRAGISARGLARFLRQLDSQTALAAAGIDPYLLTHPLTRERIAFVERHVAQSPHSDAPLAPGKVAAYERMKAKLEGFLDRPRDVLARYDGDDSLPGRYARAIAHFRVPELGRALELMDQLIAEHPDDPFFHELKGQMLFENGRMGEAIGPYREAVRLLPRSALIRFGLARAMIESGDASLLPAAAEQLEETVRIEPDNAAAWRQLGIALGRQGQEGVASLALAEYSLLMRRLDDARMHLRRAEARLEPGGRNWIRAQDLERAIEEAGG